MTDRPTLQQIADMPLSAGLAETRRWYDPKWRGALAVEREGEKSTYRVEVEWSVTNYGTETHDVEAVDEDEAKELAEELAATGKHGTIDVEGSRIVARFDA